MTEENFGNDNLEYHLVTILGKLDDIRKEKNNEINNGKNLPMKVELRSLEFWKSTISECLASFIYVFLVCGAVAGPTNNMMLLTYPLTCGFSMTFLTTFFGHVSGAHVNPAVSFAMGVIKRISVLRAATFILVQSLGGIAGAAFLYGLKIPQHQENSTVVNMFTPLERFGLEFILSCLVVFSYFMSMDTFRRWTGTGPLTIGMTYAACSFVYMPYLNPARSLGPSFVRNHWISHWVDWLGPMVGGLVAGLCYEYIFNPNICKKLKKNDDDDHSSLPSDDDINYDDLDKPPAPKFHGSTYNTYTGTGVENARSNYCPSLYSAPPTRLERVESLYGGTKSLYCKSPPLTRANLNRSQSVYTKSNTAINKDTIPKPGPLVPAQSLYSMRVNQHNPAHLQNQNVQNQMQQRGDTYGIRGVTPGTSARSDNYSTTERQLRQDNYSTTERTRRENYTATSESAYGSRNSPPSSSESSEMPPPPTVKSNRRPESTYGLLSAQQRNYQQQKSNIPYPGPPEGRSVIGAVATHRPPPPAHANPITSAGSYHHQHSPNPQY